MPGTRRYFWGLLGSLIGSRGPWAPVGPDRVSPGGAAGRGAIGRAVSHDPALGFQPPPSDARGSAGAEPVSRGSRAPWAAARSRSPPRARPAGSLHRPDTSLLSPAAVSPGAGTTSLPPSAERGTSAAPIPRARAVPAAPRPGSSRPGAQRMARGSTGALTIEGIFAASLSERVTTSCSRNPRKIPGAPGTPICSVPAAGRAPRCCPPGPAAYQLRGGDPAPLIGNGHILPNLAKALLATSWGLSAALKPG